MKIKIERKSFIDALSVGGQMTGKAKGLSVLDNVKCTFKDGMATISSYDGEVAITKRTKIVEQDEECAVCLEPKTLGAILNSLKDEIVEFDFHDHKCEIVHSKGVLSVPYFDTDDYPSPIIDAKKDSFELQSVLLFNWLKEAKGFVSTNTLYPQLMCVCLYVGENEFGVAATDASTLYHDKIEYDYHGEQQQLTLSIKAINALLPMINGSEKVVIINSERNVMFRTNDSMLVATKSELPFPNFKAIIPTNNHIEVELNKNDFMESIKRTMITADEKTCLLKFTINGMMMKIDSENTLEGRKSHDECVCVSNGVDMSIAMNGNYVINMVNAIESETMKLTLNAFNKPVLWIDMLNNDKVLLQMPCAI